MEVLELGVEFERPGLALPQILLRETARSFWKETAAKLLEGKHVVAVGSPGIGKSSTHPYLLKLLLETGRPVVFLKRGKPPKYGTYYEFRPKDGGYEAFEYKEKDVQSDTIASLLDPDAFLLIEPFGHRNVPDRDVMARIALVCSPNNEHYGGMEKTGPGEFGACFLYFPHWSLDELYEARPYMCENGIPILADDKAVFELYERFGPIPRHVFATKLTLIKLKENQDKAINRLIMSDVVTILDAIESDTALDIDESNKASPSSLTVAYRSVFPFTSRTIVIASKYVEQKVWSRHLGLLWQDIKYGVAPTARREFEKYCRKMIANPTSDGFPIRLATGGKQAEIKLGQVFRSEVKRSIKIVDAELQSFALSSGILYHSLSDKQKLVDCLGKREDGGVDGFQFTTGREHECQPVSMGEFASTLGTAERPFRLYYVVPSSNFLTFKTNPVKPVATNAEVYILSIPPPSSSSEAASP